MAVTEAESAATFRVAFKSMEPEEASVESEVIEEPKEPEEVVVDSVIDRRGMGPSYLHDKAKHTLGDAQHMDLDAQHRAARNDHRLVSRGPHDKPVQRMGRHVFYKHLRRRVQNSLIKVSEDTHIHCEVRIAISDRSAFHAACDCSVTLHRHRNAYRLRQVSILPCQHERALALCGQVEPQRARIFELHEHSQGGQVPS